MKNEIKEILAYFEKYVKTTDMHYSEPMLNWKDLKIVLDYITNLQEENKDYKSRIEKAIEYIKQYREVYYPDEPLSEPIIQYGLGIYEEDFNEEKLLNILQEVGKDE